MCTSGTLYGMYTVKIFIVIDMYCTEVQLINPCRTITTHRKRIYRLLRCHIWEDLYRGPAWSVIYP